MAQTINACNVLLKVDDGTGSMVNISGISNQVSLVFLIATRSKRLTTIDFQAVYDETDTAVSEGFEDWFINGGFAELYIPNADGSFRYSGNFNVVGFQKLISPGVGEGQKDPSMYRFSLTSLGKINRVFIGRVFIGKEGG